MVHSIKFSGGEDYIFRSKKEAGWLLLGEFSLRLLLLSLFAYILVWLGVFSQDTLFYLNLIVFVISALSIFVRPHGFLKVYKVEELQCEFSHGFKLSNSWIYYQDELRELLTFSVQVFEIRGDCYFFLNFQANAKVGQEVLTKEIVFRKTLSVRKLLEYESQAFYFSNEHGSEIVKISFPEDARIGLYFAAFLAKHQDSHLKFTLG